MGTKVGMISESMELGISEVYLKCLWGILCWWIESTCLNGRLGLEHGARQDAAPQLQVDAVGNPH